MRTHWLSTEGKQIHLEFWILKKETYMLINNKIIQCYFLQETWHKYAYLLDDVS